MQCDRFVDMITLCILMLAIVSVHRVKAQACTSCAAVDSCYQPYSFDGTGQIDVRITNPSTPVKLPVVVAPGSSCAAGLEPCCTGEGVNGCGIRYNIPLTSATTPGTSDAQYGSQPWQASMHRTGSLEYVGGAVLLSATTLLTAAHKVSGFVKQPGNLTVRLGEWDANVKTEPFEPQDRVVARITMHPDYTQSNLYNDIAVLKLAAAVTLAPAPNPAINTICAPTAGAVLEGRRCHVAGWGKNAFNGTLQARMRLVNVPIISNAQCQASLQKTRLGPSFVLNGETFLCAGGEAGRDACVGDGGSALVCNIGGRFQAVGLVSWGIGCANATIPGVYVRVATYLAFIKANE